MFNEVGEEERTKGKPIIVDVRRHRAGNTLSMIVQTPRGVCAPDEIREGKRAEEINVNVCAITRKQIWRNPSAREV